MQETQMIKKQLIKLKLHGMEDYVEQRLRQAIDQNWAHSTLLETLLTDELDRRQNKKMHLRIARSRLDVQKTLETLDFNFNSQIPWASIRELACCQFIENKENVFLLGKSGVGKSHIAQGLGHEACRRGIDVAFYRTHELFDWIFSGRGDGSYKKRMAQIVKIPLLILDDLGLQVLSSTQQDDFYEIIYQRYEKQSMIITSNRDIDEWTSLFSNPLLGTASVDRLVHRGIPIIIEGLSYRAEEYQKRCKKTKNEKAK